MISNKHVAGKETWDALLKRYEGKDNKVHGENQPEKVANNREYEVMPGDSIYRIAERHGVLPDVIMQANDLNSTVLSVGRVLVIP